MRMRGASKLLRLTREESGQSMAILGFGVFLLLGLAGISIEIGHGYYALELLQASTDSAALAAAQGLPNATTAQSNATTFSAEAFQWNRNNIMQVTNLTVTPYCSTTVANPTASLGYNTPCVPAVLDGTPYNAVTVTQTAQFATWFGNIGPIHAPLFHLSATASAAMAGGNLPPYNIALIIDTTGTMKDTDTSGDCGTGTYTAEDCALEGVQTLLLDSNPCGTLQTCTSSGATPVDAYSLFVFPMVTGDTAADDSNCGSSSPTTAPYTVPTHPTATWDSSGVLNGGSGYEVLNFAAGLTYKATDLSTTLNTGDKLVNASGDGCTGNGLKVVGTKGTYLAQVIYEAGVALQQEQAARPGSDNAIIILSDGNMDATMQYTKSGSTITGLDLSSGTPAELQPTSGIASGGSYSQVNGTKVPGWSSQANTYTYPSAVGQCGQSVQASYDVANKTSVIYSTPDGTSTTYTLNNGDPTRYTQVFTIAYQSPNSSVGAGNSSSYNGQGPEYPGTASVPQNQACFSDLPYDVNNNWWTSCTAATCTVTLNTGGGAWPAGEPGFNATGGSSTIVATSPCASLAAMASNPRYFFSDEGGGCPVTVSGNIPEPPGTTTNGLNTMQSIFGHIFSALTVPKLIPNGTA